MTLHRALLSLKLRSASRCRGQCRTALLTAALGAQQDERWQALEAQIDRIYAQNEYALPRFGPARWLADGTAYTTVERGTGQAGGTDIVRYDAATGARSILISNTQLTPAGARARAHHRRLRLVGRWIEAADLHEHAEGVAAEHARRLLGAERQRRRPEAGRHQRIRHRR